jgi:ADP-dependent NAD(P)H-hydrate dehydratase / NAD(P)H-hydrate epimerase
MVAPLANALAAAQAKGDDASMGFGLVLDADGVIQRPRLTPPPADTHKYERGHAVVISGPPLRTGAARLTAQAALSVGAGLVTILGEEAALAEHAAQVTAIMLRPVDPMLSTLDDRVRAIAVGPAAGVGPETRDLVQTVLARGCAAVIDADGLTSFEGQPEALFEALHPNAILTPHEGEFRRLFPDLDPAQRHHAVGRAATRCGAVVLLKGPETLIACPDGRIAINRHASPWLATAGSGDVLTGLITGLLAEGNATFDAACIAAWLHGDIGVRGGAGLTADRMDQLIPLVLAGCLSEG